MIIKTRRGYTLLELLVVIAIIAILATVGLVSYVGTQRAARDSKRIGDLRTISNALEQYYTICGNVYPTPPNGITSNMYTTVACPDPAITILEAVPNEPNGDSYVCTGCTDTTYNVSSTEWEAKPMPYPSFSGNQ